jgi:uncharacterized protein YggU (UPF0235/DUF167 family)
MKGRNAWSGCKTGLRLVARVTPRSARDRVGGLVDTAEGPALQVRVRAVAENGRANAAVEKVVAHWLGLAKTRVTVAQGHKSRIKVLDISGETGELEVLAAARVAALN